MGKDIDPWDSFEESIAYKRFRCRSCEVLKSGEIPPERVDAVRTALAMKVEDGGAGAARLSRELKTRGVIVDWRSIQGHRDGAHV